MFKRYVHNVKKSSEIIRKLHVEMRNHRLIWRHCETGKSGELWESTKL